MFNFSIQRFHRASQIVTTEGSILGAGYTDDGRIVVAVDGEPTIHLRGAS